MDSRTLGAGVCSLRLLCTSSYYPCCNFSHLVLHLVLRASGQTWLPQGASMSKCFCPNHASPCALHAQRSCPCRKAPSFCNIQSFLSIISMDMACPSLPFLHEQDTRNRCMQSLHCSVLWCSSRQLVFFVDGQYGHACLRASLNLFVVESMLNHGSDSWSISE